MAISPTDLLHCLKAELSDQGLPSDGGDLYPGVTLKGAAAISLVNSLLKKIETGRTEETDALALEKFLACNLACKEWVPPEFNNSGQETLIGTVKQFLYDFWYRNGYSLFDHPFQILERGRIGPGSNIGSRGQDFYTKFFASPLTMADQNLYFWYKTYIAKFPDWSEAETFRLGHYGEPRIELGSRLSFVPKNDEISRCICIEPTLNTYYQLGLGALLEDRLYERFGISLSKQPFRNRALARLGSITDNLSTIDLSSASDSISLRMLKCFLPDDFYRQLVKYRSPAVFIKSLGTTELHMVSTMGNGYTFPLQTILFSCIVAACMRFRDITGSNTSSCNSWGVFGDDIICPRLVTRDVIYVLHYMGFRVNSDKTFVEGPFRESCGSDFFMGSDIRGVYVKRLTTPESRYSVINLLARFSTKTGISLTNTLKYLLRTVDFLPVPPWEDFSSGVHVPFDRSYIKERDKSTQSYVYRLRVPHVPQIRISEEGIRTPKGSKKRIYNPSGLLISFLQGSIHSESIGVRVDSVRYRTKRRVTSSWDVAWTSEPESLDYGTDWGRWNTVVSFMTERS